MNSDKQCVNSEPCEVTVHVQEKKKKKGGREKTRKPNGHWMPILWMTIIQYYEYNNVMLPRQIIVDLFFKFIMEVIIHVMLPPVLLI